MDIAKKILVIVTSGVIGACLMLAYTEKFGTNNNYQILYVAEDELMSLEETRVKNENQGLVSYFSVRLRKR
jgi:hypothetical protein